jgi:hypothetical protein
MKKQANLVCMEMRDTIKPFRILAAVIIQLDDKINNQYHS